MASGTGTEPALDGGAQARDPDRGAAAGREPLELRVERLTAERDALRARLTEAEQHLAELPELRAARDELKALRSSRSWRATAPLRRAAGSARRELIPRARLAVKRALMRLAARVRD